MKSLMLKKIHLSGNDKIIALNVISAFAIKGLALILSVFSMPAYIRFFNDDATLGIWFTILSVLNWILNFDLGIGNGLRNHLTKAYTEDNKDEAKKYVSSAYFSIGIISLVAAIIFVFVFKFVNWNRAFNITNFVISENALYTTVIIVFLGILLQLFLKLISSVIYAIQKSAINNMISLITSILTVSSLYLLPSSTNDVNIVVMAIVHLVAVNLPLLVATSILFLNKRYRFLCPSVKSFDLMHSKSVLSLGGIFFFVQIVYMIIMSTNEYLITLFVGSEPVVEYQVYYRLFTLIGTLFVLAMTPIWSSVTKALTEKNYKWINSLYKKVLVLAWICIAGEFLIIPLSQFVVNIWLGKGVITMSFENGLAFAALGSLMILNSVLSTFANGAGELKTQAVFFSIGAVIKIPLAWLLVKAFDSWIMVVWTNVMAMLLYCVIQPIWLKRYLLKFTSEKK